MLEVNNILEIQFYMEKNNHLEKWVDALKKRDLEQFVATLLEATKPMNFIFAQLVYIGQPCAGWKASRSDE